MPQQPTPPEPSDTAPRPAVIAAYVAGGLLLFASGVFLGLSRPPEGRGAAPVGAAEAASPAPVPTPADDPPRLPTKVRYADLEGLDGERFRLDYALGSGVVVVALFSTESPASLDAIPALVELDQEFAGELVELFALSVDDPRAARGEVTRFAAGLEMRDSFAFVPYDAARALSPTGRRGVPVPQVLVLTPEGRVARHLVGFRPDEDLPVLRGDVRRLLSQRGTDDDGEDD